MDVARSECDVDLASGRLPFPDATFSAIASQHVIEHFEMNELERLLHDVRRVLRKDGEVWLSCPDMEKICVAYIADRCAALVEDRRQRSPRGCPAVGAPPQQLVNLFFHQWGEHKNLYDFDLLAWVLERAGFRSCVRVVEADLLRRFPEFPPRGDDLHTLYIVARP